MRLEISEKSVYTVPTTGSTFNGGKTISFSSFFTTDMNLRIIPRCAMTKLNRPTAKYTGKFAYRLGKARLYATYNGLIFFSLEIQHFSIKVDD